MLSSITSSAAAFSAAASSRPASVPRAIAAQAKSATDFVDTFESSDGVKATRSMAAKSAVTPVSLNDAPQQSDQDEFRKVFHRFVGETLFSQMLKAMRASQQPIPYFGGGRAEEIFQGQLDQLLTEKMTSGTPDSLSSTMFNLMTARQKM